MLILAYRVKELHIRALVAFEDRLCHAETGGACKPDS